MSLVAVLPLKYEFSSTFAVHDLSLASALSGLNRPLKHINTEQLILPYLYPHFSTAHLVATTLFLYTPSISEPPMLITTTTMSKNTKVEDILSAGSESDNDDVQLKKSSTLADVSDDDFQSDDDEEQVFQTKKKVATSRFDEDAESDEEPEKEEEEANQGSEHENDLSDDENEIFFGKGDEATAVVSEQKTRSKKLKRLTPEQLAKEQKKIKKTGVCYLSSIPPYMKPVKLRSVLSRFGKLDRVFLKPEDAAAYLKRVKYGGNKKKKYTEGWVEFVNKKDAKLCAQTMNGNILGGKKSSYYHDDVINIKYLSGFKWFDLTQQIAKENEIRQSKLALEVSQQAKLNKTFVNNVEKSRYISRKRKTEEAEGNDEKKIAKRTFDQRGVSSTRADAGLEFKKDKNSDDLQNILSKVF